MPLTPYLRGGVFEPKQIAAMAEAFQGVCRSLQLSDRMDDPFTEIVARKIIEIATTGVYDSSELRDLVLLALKNGDQRSA
jgi:hypothetical protein